MIFDRFFRAVDDAISVHRVPSVCPAERSLTADTPEAGGTLSTCPTCAGIGDDGVPSCYPLPCKDCTALYRCPECGGNLTTNHETPLDESCTSCDWRYGEF